MCFLEFIGYTCGHISLPVLRPCPLTTASHTFPTCPRRGDKPFLAGEMCPTCQKIVHSRATQIEEYEHRFMHERGVCGCETIFPYLIRPRIIGGGDLASSNNDCSDDEAAADTVGDSGASVIPLGLDDDTYHAVSSSSSSAASDGAAVPVPPILREALDVGGKSVVSVRLPSLYAAEWVTDHRERHEAGLCDCRVDLRTYGQATREDTDEAEALAEPDEYLYLAAPAVPALRRVLSLSSMPASGVAEVREQARKHQRSTSHEAFSYGSGAADDWTTFGTAGAMTAASDSLTRFADAATPLAHSSKPPATGYLAQPLRAGRPVRYSGAVFTKVPGYLPLTGPFLARPTPFPRSNSHVPVVDGILDADTRRGPHSGGTGTATQHAVDARKAASMMQHHVGQALDRSPLLGYPIGAGPEGVPHAAPWQGQPSCWK